MLKKIAILLLILITLTVRLFPVDFPKFTTEEARIAHRGYTLARYGTEELGRKFPLIFNSLEDYQLPITSYLTMIGILAFGKTDLGVRIPFILIGTLLVILTFEISKFFTTDSRFRFVSAGIIASSPTLIFLSKTPNEIIVLVFLFTLLFYLLVNNKNLLLIIGTMVLTSLVSKFAWFILLPFILYMLWIIKLKHGRLFIAKQQAHLILGFAILIMLSAFVLFFNIPQSKRSLMENNFSIFSDITIQNGINRLRGQGMQSGWPFFIDRLLFNKLNFLAVGLLHWLSHLNPAIYFGQFDKNGELNYSYLGTWPKILILPAILGLIVILKKPEKKGKLFLLLLILTYPSILIYPSYSLDLIVLTLPFMAMIITTGIFKLIEFNKKIVILVLLFVVLELVLNLYNFYPEYKNTNTTRPGWIKNIAEDVFKSSTNNQTAISDDIVSDIIPFLRWYTPVGDDINSLDIPWPYKYRQYNLSSIKIIASDDKFRTCGLNEKLPLFVSKRDLNKIQHDTQIEPSYKYKDNLDEEKAYQITQKICLE